MHTISILVFLVAVVFSYGAKLNIGNCGNPAIKVIRVETHSSSKTISKDTELTLTYNSNADLSDQDTVLVNIKELKLSKFGWIYLNFRDRLLDAAAQYPSPDPNVKFIKKTKEFLVGCPVLSKYTKCPPLKGMHQESLRLSEMFKAISRKLNLSISGYAKATVEIKKYGSNQVVACIKANIYAKL